MHKLIKLAKLEVGSPIEIKFNKNSLLKYEQDRPVFGKDMFPAEKGFVLKSYDGSDDSAIGGSASALYELKELYSIINKVYEASQKVVVEILDKLGIPIPSSYTSTQFLDSFSSFNIYFNDPTMTKNKLIEELSPYIDKIVYSYNSGDNTIQGLTNFIFLLNSFQNNPNQEPSYKISKASLGNFLTSQDSKEKDLLKKFINELNSYYSSDNSKSIINVYNGKDDALYSFIGYTKQDLDKFINDYSDDNYLKQIYVNLIKNIEPGKDIIGDAILQL